MKVKVIGLPKVFNTPFVELSLPAKTWWRLLKQFLKERKNRTCTIFMSKLCMALNEHTQTQRSSKFKLSKSLTTLKTNIRAAQLKKNHSLESPSLYIIFIIPVCILLAMTWWLRLACLTVFPVCWEVVIDCLALQPANWPLWWMSGDPKYKIGCQWNCVSWTLDSWDSWDS